MSISAHVGIVTNLHPNAFQPYFIKLPAHCFPFLPARIVAGNANNREKKLLVN
jgi:hypothetical protein